MVDSRLSAATAQYLPPNVERTEANGKIFSFLNNNDKLIIILVTIVPFALGPVVSSHALRV